MIAGIIGATGYAGAELVRLLSGHPKIEKLKLSSVSYEGQQIENIYPNFLNRVTGLLLKAEDVIASSDVVFSALPHAVGEHFAAACMERKIHYIDLSADYRFGVNSADNGEAVYSAWYGKNYQFPELHKKTIYGLPELNRQKIKEEAAKGPVIIGNPGCYPTGATLGILPCLQGELSKNKEPQRTRSNTEALEHKSSSLRETPCTPWSNLISYNTPIIINSVTGVSGGGREPSRSFHYPECADSIMPYKVASHRH
ncbi:MAG: hypothetical protein FWD13_12125, partial [Treponema sp.]|nr:hypothetical protein [Treponema sp.]